MKRQDVLVALAVILLGGCGVKPAAASDLPPPAAIACTAKDPRAAQFLQALNSCLVTKGEPLFLSDKDSGAVAEALLSICAAELKRVSEFTKACHATPLDPGVERRTIIGVVENRRSRADFLWDQGGWAKGACSINDPTFGAEIRAHVKCMTDGDWHDAPLKSTGAVAEAALAQCAAKEAPIRQRLSGCQGARAPAIMSGYRVFAQEIVMARFVQALMMQATPKDTPAEWQTDRLYELRTMYDACLMFETKARAAPGGDPDAILRRAAQICAMSRTKLAAHASQHLSPGDAATVLDQTDGMAEGMAGFELEAVGLKATSPSDH